MQLTKDFQQILIDFFTKYDEKNLKTVPDIMKRFRQNKQQVILHLCNKYNVDINTLDGVDMTGEPQKPAAAVPIEAAGGKGETPVAETEEGAAVEGATAGEEAPKKKSKVVMIIIVIVGLAVLGGGGYFAYDKFLGDGSSDKEEVAPEEAAAESVAEPEPEPAPAPEVVDTTASDTTATDTTEADAGDSEGGDAPE